MHLGLLTRSTLLWCLDLKDVGGLVQFYSVNTPMSLAPEMGFQARWTGLEPLYCISLGISCRVLTQLQ